MSDEVTPVVITRTVTVEAPPERAFEVFTAGIDRWWPHTHRIGDAPMATAVLEGREGGRWYERGEDGVEHDWGQVQAWDPPRRLVVSWQLGGDYRYDPDPAKGSEWEVRFAPEGDGRTRVDLEHRGFERQGTGGQAVADSVASEGGWSGLLELYAGAVGA